MTDFFPGDRYTTPEGLPRAKSEYVLLGTRWSVYSHFFAVILKSMPQARAGTYDDERWARSSWDLIRNLERCGARFEISGMDRVRNAEGPLVLVANHMSTLETVILPGIVRPMKPVTYVVKKSLTEGPFWGPIMRSRDPIVVTRKDPRLDLETVLREGPERLSKGISVIVFPQGRRTEAWRREAFNSLGAKLAARTGALMVPVAVKTDFWGANGLFKGFGPVHRDRIVHVEFGEPMAVAGRGKTEHEACLDFIEGRLRTWGARMAEIEAAKPNNHSL